MDKAKTSDDPFFMTPEEAAREDARWMADLPPVPAEWDSAYWLASEGHQEREDLEVAA